MPWPNRHRRFRDQLSAYLDGELVASRREKLEQHLASCAPCRRELADLRAAVRALSELPEADVPRSFALGPDQLQQAARPAAPRLPLAAPLMAGALAFALAAVLVVDLGDFGSGAPVSMSQTAEDRSDTFDADREPAEAPEGGIVTGAASSQQTPEALAPAPSPPPESIEEGGDVIRRETAPPQPEPEPAAAGRAGGDGGLDPLRAAEIGLAAALAAVVVGGVGYVVLMRRRT